MEMEMASVFLLDALYCEEEKWDFGEEEEHEEEREERTNPSLLPLLLLEQDLFWEDEELLSLFSKEEEQQIRDSSVENDRFLSSARREAVEWMLKVNGHHGFSTFTAILAVNYLDRFLSRVHLQSDKPWMIQLAAVTCLSLAAKVEETHVPLLLELQVEGTKYLFEAKAIQKMELLILSTLEWKMHPVTPLSFLDHIIRRLGLKNHQHWEFLRKCESLLLWVLPDSRFVSYQSSVLATATMMNVIDQIEPSNPHDYKNQLLTVLNFSKGKVDECYQVMSDAIKSERANGCCSLKRKYEEFDGAEMAVRPSSPSGVIDGYLSFSCESSNDSWGSSSSAVAVVMKKGRVREQHMPLPSVSCRVFVGGVGGSPH